MTTTKRYAISQAGREAYGNFTLAEARKELALIRDAEKKAAKSRYGSAHLHSAGDSFSITLAPDKRSALWTSAGIVEA